MGPGASHIAAALEGGGIGARVTRYTVAVTHEGDG